MWGLLSALGQVRLAWGCVECVWLGGSMAWLGMTKRWWMEEGHVRVVHAARLYLEWALLFDMESVGCGCHAQMQFAVPSIGMLSSDITTSHTLHLFCA